MHGRIPDTPFQKAGYFLGPTGGRFTSENQNIPASRRRPQLRAAASARDAIHHPNDGLRAPLGGVEEVFTPADCAFVASSEMR